MAFKDIIAVCDGSKASEGAVRYALTLTKAVDGHLTGIVAHGVSLVMANIGGWAPAEVYEVMAENDAKVRADIRASFDAITGAAGREGKIHFLDIAGDPDTAVARAARCFDAIVMGPRDNAREAAHFRPHPDVMALRGGRPVIYVPVEAAGNPAPKRAVLAWDGQGASARAMAEALPMFAGMEEVVVVSVGTPDDEAESLNNEAVRHLMRHGVHATGKVVPRDKGGIAATLLAAAAEVRADILVMGAYEHAKLAEDIFGGVTDSVLREATLPVFLAH